MASEKETIDIFKHAETGPGSVHMVYDKERNEKDAPFIEQREKYAAQREERREKGICIDCGKNPSSAVNDMCDDCNEASDYASDAADEMEKIIMKSNQAFADEIDYITDSENENRTFTTGQFEEPEIPEDSLFKDKENLTTEGFTPKKDVVYLDNGDDYSESHEVDTEKNK